MARFRDLLKPGRILAVIGLYRMEDIEDYGWAALGLPASRLFRCFRPYQEVKAPVHAPAETLRTISSRMGFDVARISVAPPLVVQMYAHLA